MTDDVICLSERSVEYLRALEKGPLETHDLVLLLMVSGNSVSKAMKRLVEVGLVVSSPVVGGGRGRRFVHCLADDFDVLRRRIVLSEFGRRSPIVEEHLLYAAMLKNDGKTGRELEDLFIGMYPGKTRNAVHNIVAKVRGRRLCR